MRDNTPWRYKLTSIHYYLDLILELFRSKKKDNMYGYVKFDLGEEVRVTIYSEDPNRWFRGVIVDINARYVLPEIESSWKVEYCVLFKNVEYWFLESELKKYCLQEERNSIIEQLLN